MPESVGQPNGEASQNGQKENAPPFVQILKTPGGCQVTHNLIDPWLAIALIEMSKETLIGEMRKQKGPRVVKPDNGLVASLRRNMRGA